MVGKDKGKQGIVSQVIQERNWVFVEGLNTHLRTVRTSLLTHYFIIDKLLAVALHTLFPSKSISKGN